MNVFTVITSDDCLWCHKAIELLKDEGLDHSIVSITNKPWLKTTFAMADISTVPQVFRPDGELIGGYEQLRVYLGRH